MSMKTPPPPHSMHVLTFASEAFRSNFMNNVPFVKYLWKVIKNRRCKCGYLRPTHSSKGSACVCLHVWSACICVHDSACLSGSSKALSGALCGPRSLPFQPPSFCLSVSYLIELAQKQSKYGYLRLRTKPYWCLVEVSPLCVHITAWILSRVSMSCTSKDIIHNDVPLFSQGSAWSLRSPSLSMNTHTHTHLATFKQVSWLISNTHMQWHICANLSADSYFWFLPSLPNTASGFTLLSSL